jgi:uncharacterized protein (DUF2235 family)
MPFAYKLYKRTDPAGLQLCAGFKQTYCRHVDVEFVGVWDTVASVGVVAGRTLPFSNANRGVKIFRHALSLDEHRAKFQPNLYHRPGPTEASEQSENQHPKTGPEATGAGFKQTYCRHVDVEFVGVWDTVASVGVVAGRTLPFSNANRGVKIFRHALSLDEHRAKFQPNLYHRPGCTEASEQSENQHPKTGPEATGDLTSAAPVSSTTDEPQRQASLGHTSLTGKRFTEGKDTGKAFAPVLEEQVIPADVLEVWFSGCHSDVGGGAVPNSTLESLANISLRWMVSEVVASGCGVIFDPAALAQARIDVSPEPTAERELDDIDCLQPIYDDLVIYKIWWMLEIMPLQFTWQDAKGVWHSKYRIHLGKGRNILAPHPNFHVTVQKRMKSALNYKPKATWAAGTEVYVQ